MFVTSMGSPVLRNHAEQEVKKILKEINLHESYLAAQEQREPVFFEDMSPHSIRHTFCSRCFEANMQPKVVQEIMGHQHYSTTIDIYTHVTGETYEEETVYEPSFPDLEPSDSIDIELYVRSDVDAPQKLVPHEVYSYLYDDVSEKWSYTESAGLNSRISELYNTLPVFTFDYTIEWYLENEEDEYSCKWFGTDLYDENFNRVSDVEDMDPEELGSGKYYAVIGYYQAGREIVDYIGNVPEDDMMVDVATVYREYGYYEYGFCIVVPEP